MPSYIHAWCSDCVKQSSGCGYNCASLSSADGPPRCADACMSSMPGVDYFSKATSVNSTFTTLGRGINLEFSGVTLTGGWGSWVLPAFGCSGEYPPGTCQQTRCASTEYAADDALGSGCDIYLPDGYASHGDAPTGSGVDDTDCTCGPGGGTGSCAGSTTGTRSTKAYATLVDTWTVSSSTSSSTPAFFCEMYKHFCQDADYCKATGSCGSGECKPAPHTWGLFAFMDGDITSSPGNPSAGYDSPSAAWPLSDNVIKIRQTAAEHAAGTKPKVYVSVRFELRLLSIGDIPASCDGGGGQGSYQHINWIHPRSWRITWVGSLASNCSCLTDITLTSVYSSSFNTTCSGADTCACTKACCSQDIEAVDCTTVAENEDDPGGANVEACVDNWCSDPCGDEFQSPPCSTTGENKCWPVCSGNTPSFDPSDPLNPPYAVNEYTSASSPTAPPCVAAACLTGCNKARTCKNSSGSLWNAGVPNVICDGCHTKVEGASEGDDEHLVDSGSNCSSEGSQSCGCGTTIGSVISGWPTMAGTFDHCSNLTVSAAGSVAITLHT